MNNYSERKALDSWDPKVDDFNDIGLSAFHNAGPAKNLSRSLKASSEFTKSQSESIALYLKNVPTSLESNSLKALLGKYGSVCSCRIVDSVVGYQTNIAFANVPSMRDALSIIENVHKKPPLNLNVEIALTAEEKAKRKNHRSKTALSPNTHTPTTGEHFEGNRDCNSDTNMRGIQSSVSPPADVGGGRGKFLCRSKVNNQQSTLMKEKECIINRSATPEQSFDEIAVHPSPPTSATSNSLMIGPSLPSRPLNCVRCNLIGSRRCSVCKASYCSKRCQEDDWFYHREKCVPPPPLEDEVEQIKDPNLAVQSFATPDAQNNLRQSSVSEVVDLSAKVETPKIEKQLIQEKPETSCREKRHNIFTPEKSDISSLEKPQRCLEKAQESTPVKTSDFSPSKLSPELQNKPQTEVDSAFFNITSTLKLNTIFEGIVTHCYSVKKFILLPWNEYTPKILSSDEDSSENTLSPSQVKPHDVIMAMSPADGLWYRALVCLVADNQTVEVYYIDFGNKEFVTLMKKIPNRLETSVIPGLALSATLNEEISPEKFSKLAAFIQCDRRMKFRVTGKKIKMVRVTLLNEGNEAFAEFIMRSCMEEFRKEMAVPTTREMAITTPKPTLPQEEKVTKIPKIFRKELKEKPVEVGKEYTVIPSLLSKGRLFVQLMGQEEKAIMLEMIKEVNEQSPKASQPEDLVEEELVCAFLEEDEIWYRGEVLQVDNRQKSALVYFFDYGDSKSIAFRNLRSFAPPLAAFPVMALAVQPVCHRDPVSDEVMQRELKSYIEDCSPLLMLVESLHPIKVTLLSVEQRDPILSPKSVPPKSKGAAAEINSGTTAHNITAKYEAQALLKSGCVKPLLLMYDECETTTLPIANNVEVIILQFTNPLSIFLTAKENVEMFEKLEELSTEMNNYCNSLKTIYYIPKEGEICLAKYKADGLWYRAVCITTEADSSLMMFVDYGNHESVPFGSLCQMVDKFLKLPLIAVHCRLKGFTLEEVEIGGDALIEKFQNLLKPYSTNLINVISKCEEEPVYTIEIPSLPLENLKRTTQ